MILSVEEYMTLSERPSILIYGLKDKYLMDMKEIKRDTPQHVRDIFRDGTCGTVNFEDVFTITFDYVEDIYKAELYYGTELVSMRAFPPLFFMKGDTLELKFKLSVYRTKDGVYV